VYASDPYLSWALCSIATQVIRDSLWSGVFRAVKDTDKSQLVSQARINYKSNRYLNPQKIFKIRNKPYHPGPTTSRRFASFLVIFSCKDSSRNLKNKRLLPPDDDDWGAVCTEAGKIWQSWPDCAVPVVLIMDRSVLQGVELYHAQHFTSLHTSQVY
jgi:hypothetical protein